MVLSDRAIERLCCKPVAKYKNELVIVCPETGNLITQNEDKILANAPEVNEILANLQTVSRLYTSLRTRYSLGEVVFQPLDESFKSWQPMIAPFVPNQVRVDENGQKILSYGLSSGGYDITLAKSFKIFSNINSQIIDPLNMSDDCYVDFEASEKQPYCIIPPNSYALGHTRETFSIPNDVLVIVVGKSTLARCGAGINCTPMEPGWSGQLVVEIANHTPLPMKIYPNMGIAQAIFHRMDAAAKVPYGADRKYANQKGLTTARI